MLESYNFKLSLDNRNRKIKGIRNQKVTNGC